jgi:hypothetical protein
MIRQVNYTLNHSIRFMLKNWIKKHSRDKTMANIANTAQRVPNHGINPV